MTTGNLLGFDDRPRRNVEVRIGKRELFSEISEPRGTIKSADVVGIRVTEELEAGNHIMRLFLDTTSQGKILFYTASTRLDIAFLLDELEASIGPRPRTWDTVEMPSARSAAAPGSAAPEELGPGNSTREEPNWKRIEASQTYYQLTGESVVMAISIPARPSSKKPALIRVTHTNSEGRVDSDVFVRIGNPKKPLKWNAFDTVSDWVRMPLVEDLIQGAAGQWEWVLRGRKTGQGVPWSGTYETEIHFPRGQHLIEMKIISRVPEVCSIVLSNWKVNVR